MRTAGLPHHLSRPSIEPGLLLVACFLFFMHVCIRLCVCIWLCWCCRNPWAAHSPSTDEHDSFFNDRRHRHSSSRRSQHSSRSLQHRHHSSNHSMSSREPKEVTSEPLKKRQREHRRRTGGKQRERARLWKEERAYTNDALEQPQIPWYNLYKALRRRKVLDYVTVRILPKSPKRKIIAAVFNLRLIWTYL